MPEIIFPRINSDGEIAAEWLRNSLIDYFPDATFSRLTCERIGEEYGFASRIFRYSWRDNQTPRSFIIKLWDLDSKAGRKEVLFYKESFALGIRIPGCFYGAIDEKQNKAILILEDIRDCIQGDCLKPLNLARAEGVARSLGRLHSRFLNNARPGGLSWIADMSDWDQSSEWIQSRRSLFLKRFGEHLDGLPRLILDKLELAPPVANRRLATAARTLLHGDFHLDNVLFENQIEPVLLDWSNLARGPAALNLAELLYFMTPLKNFDRVVGYYLEEHYKESGTVINPEDLTSQLGGALLRKFAAVTCGIALWQPSSPRAPRIIEANIERVNLAVEFWQARDPELFSFVHN